MNPLVLLAIAGGAALITSLIRKAKAANNLKYDLKKIQIYKLTVSDLILRVWIDFTNLENTQLVVQQIYLDIYLDFGTAEKPDIQRIGTLNTNAEIIIPALQTVSKSFDITVSYFNLLGTALQMFKSKFSGGAVNFPKKATVKGQIKALNITIPINYEVPFEG